MRQLNCVVAAKTRRAAVDFRRVSEFGDRLSGHDRSYRLFLGYQPQEQLPMGVVFGQGQPPFKEFKIFGLYEFFHGVLPSGSLAL